jgi:hypothetical protein
MIVEKFWFQLFGQSKSRNFMILQNHRNYLDGAMFDKSKVVRKKEQAVQLGVCNVVSPWDNTINSLNES